ncbi:MAG: universal stress protein [Gaiellaceae bacterium]
MGTIVCGIDDSRGAAEALRVASALSERLQLRLVLVHVAPGFRTAEGADSVTAVQARTGAEGLVERIAKKHIANGSVDKRAEVGDPAEVLAQIAAEESADLIVLGSRRRRRKLVSGLAAGLSTVAPCPVVVVPPAARLAVRG